MESVNMEKALWHCNHDWTFTDVGKKMLACSYTALFFQNSTVYLQPNDNVEMWHNISTNGVSTYNSKHILSTCLDFQNRLWSGQKKESIQSYQNFLRIKFTWIWKKLLTEIWVLFKKKKKHACMCIPQIYVF